MVRIGYGTMDCQAIPISTLLEGLTQLSGRTVVDKTGLAGRYDVKLRWTPEDSRPNADAGSSATEGPEVDFFTALQEQLGLKLVPAKGPVNALVVDQIAKPSND
jgi:uncharacterized protein (TIGR03435 family)